MRFVEGRTLAAADLRDPVLLARVATLLRRCHAEVARHLAGAAPEFQPFTLFRHYDRLLRETMWGMVAQATSPLALDYAAYVAEQLARLAAARARWQG